MNEQSINLKHIVYNFLCENCYLVMIRTPANVGAKENNILLTSQNIPFCRHIHLPETYANFTFNQVLINEINSCKYKHDLILTNSRHETRSKDARAG